MPLHVETFNSYPKIQSKKPVTKSLAFFIQVLELYKVVGYLPITLRKQLLH